MSLPFDELGEGVFRRRYASLDLNIGVVIGGDGVLVIDMGGVHGQLQQRIDLNRLCLTEGEEFTMNLYLAQRNQTGSTFRFETNLILKEGADAVAVTDFFD